MEHGTVWPRVVMDIGIGQHVHELDVDLDAVTEHLRERGMSDEAIADLEIHFVDTETRRNRNLDGKYRRLNHKIEVYTERPFRTHQKINRFLGEADPENKYANENSTLSSRSLRAGFNETLYHELEHVIARSEGDRSDTIHIAKSAGKMLLKGCGIAGIATGSLWVSEYATGFEASPMVVGAVLGVAIVGTLKQQSVDARKMYQTSPEEARCKLAERDSGLVTVKFKASSGE